MNGSLHFNRGLGEGVCFSLNLAGQEWKIIVPRCELEKLHIPLLKEIESRFRTHGGRFIVFLAGPPGCGKTTIALLWETLSKRGWIDTPLQALPMDGFHYSNVVLNSRTINIDGETFPLYRIKGAPESYDLDAIEEHLKALREGENIMWPLYDRKIHDPVQGVIPVISEGIIVVEGNYLLLDKPRWRNLHIWADLGVFIECPEGITRESLLARHRRGGRTPEEAISHYEFNDKRNRQIILSHRQGVDILVNAGSDQKPATYTWI